MRIFSSILEFRAWGGGLRFADFTVMLTDATLHLSDVKGIDMVLIYIDTYRYRKVLIERYVGIERYL